MTEEKDPSIFQIALSLLAAFCGVQNKENMARDERYIEKKGIKVYIIMGFFLVFCLLITLFGIVQLILHFAM
ncbi:MAG TPA: DUF2970 domain-containing protein [Thiotrichaceae bacterium]|jgi:hypothetical protein|nr:DUF2970 domain-containing protein [Thiotrichaceae bacterium]HIM08104.1 DUF2970 domain-containing protein [Gammaproteobacteria bacterium]